MSERRPTHAPAAAPDRVLATASARGGRGAAALGPRLAAAGARGSSRPRGRVAAALGLLVALGCARGRTPEAPPHRAPPTSASAPAGASARLEPSACATPTLRALQAACYTFRGPEDWDAPAGRQVELPVAVLAPATDAIPGAPPVYFFPGGPGYSVLDHRGYLAQLREDVGARTLVLMDHRGFVHARPALRCPDYAAVSPYHHVVHTAALTGPADPMARMRTLTEAVRACYAKLAGEGIDVAQYNSHAVSRDVDAIRRALGHEVIDVFGSSTGSGTALLYLGYFPAHVRAAVFGWPWYNHLRNRPPVDEFYLAKQTFTDVLARCVADEPRCRRMLPAWLRALDRVRRALDDAPFVATVAHDGEARTLRFDGAAFLATLYLTLDDVHARLPRLVAELLAGDRSGLSDFFRVDRYDPDPSAPRYALGYFLAHLCNDMGANRPTPADSLAAVRREPALLGFEPPWLCAWWGRDGDVPPQHNDPVESPVPALAIHGQLDPCCGTRWSERLAETMPNLQIVELEGVGHAPVTACRSRLIRDFLADPRAPVDDGCRDEVPLGPWELSAGLGRARGRRAAHDPARRRADEPGATEGAAPGAVSGHRGARAHPPTSARGDRRARARYGPGS